jgi:hypothetical protein
MTTPGEFLERVDRVVAATAFSLACTPCDRQEAFLKQFEGNVKAQWREVFASYLSPSSVDAMVDDAVAQVRRRRDAIEAAGVGSA